MEFVPPTIEAYYFLQNDRLSRRCLYLLIINKEEIMAGKVSIEYPPEFLRNQNLTDEDLKQVTVVERKQPD
jgi:hypothetical protein